MKYVYVLQSVNGEHFYVGVTDNTDERLKAHNAGRVPHAAKHGPWLLTTFVAFSDERRAFAFERYLKTGSGRALSTRHF